MNTVRVGEAIGYTAPGHSLMDMVRLQGLEAGPSDTVWIGLSIIQPGGGTTASAAEVEKFYVVVQRTLEVEAFDGSKTARAELGPLDSCRIAPRETRRLKNTGSQPCRVLLIMPKGK